jgi:2-dehydro-3-deoxyphosphooctonate aldolase (KDO 8-P synthase)
MNYQDLKEKFFIISGPNVIESEEHVLFMAKALKEKLSNYNVNFIFKVSFDKANRTSLNSYRGVSFEEGLRIIKKVRDEVNVPIITDIHESWQAKPVSEVVDIIQIPAFLCRQTDLLKAAAETGKIIQIKKGQFCSADVMHKAKEKIISFGNPNVILCERGNSFGYQDLVVDPRNLVWLKSDTNLVSMDITHCLQQPAQKMDDGTVKAGGLRELIPYMGKMAFALGVNGIFMEIHDRPDESFCDAPTQWPLDKLDWLMKYIGVPENKNNIYKIYNDFCSMEDLTRIRKLMAHEHLFNIVLNIPGNIVEFGVFNGTSLFQFLKFKKILCPNSQKKIIGFDFFDEKIVIDQELDKIHMDNLYKDSDFEGLSPEYFYNKAKKFGCDVDKDLELVRGNVMETLDKYLSDKPGFRISLLHMDLDIEEPTYYVLEKLYNYMVKGGVIAFDEYNLGKWSESNAVDRFLKNHPELNIETVQWFEYPSAIIRIK